MTKDLTVGTPSRVLWRFALPLMGSVVFQQLYQIADSFVAGKYIGQSALASVGNAYEVTLVYLAFAVGCNIGCSVVISQLFGAKRNREMKTAVTTMLTTALLLCALLMCTGFLATPALLRFIKTPEEIFSDTVLYLNIYTAGLPFLFLYNISNGIFSALGDSRTPFIFLAASSTANIFADILFVSAFDLGIAGVAYATFLCQGISCVAALTTVAVKLKHIPAEGKPVLFSLPTLAKIVCIAVPSILQQSFVSVGNIIIQSIVNGFSVAVIAGYAAAIKVNNFAITSLTTLGTAVSNYSAQNYGAGDRRRMHAGFRAGILLGSLTALLFTGIYMLLRVPLISLFMSGDATDALAVGTRFLLIVPPFYLFPALKLVADGVLRGSGTMRYFMITTFANLFLRVGLAFPFSRLWGETGVWLAWPVGWMISTFISLLFYRTGVWEKKMITNTEIQQHEEGTT